MKKKTSRMLLMLGFGVLGTIGFLYYKESGKTPFQVISDAMKKSNRLAYLRSAMATALADGNNPDYVKYQKEFIELQGNENV